ncbi:hypothetical protein MsAg5_04140 [Methanosarcinaceae archaeon Ag5]|uniref:Uncharacterized protein n=1 Tax=Methanolapillus africanus TaxID=3028297 RepID=A0AAE4MII3_9EURY|nr:hypothetical protein [Methanosarcinaceae archaeon Ag5]
MKYQKIIQNTILLLVFLILYIAAVWLIYADTLSGWLFWIGVVPTFLFMIGGGAVYGYISKNKIVSTIFGAALPIIFFWTVFWNHMSLQVLVLSVIAGSSGWFFALQEKNSEIKGLYYVIIAFSIFFEIVLFLGSFN